MLVIISDLHLTDGSAGATIQEGAFKVFRERLRDLAYDASWRSPGPGRKKGGYKPIRRLDVVLLGDILDVIRSDKWPAVSPEDASYVRPWHVADTKKRSLFDDTVASINDSILAYNAASLGVLKNLVVTLPPARKGLPVKVSHEATSEDRVPVDVALHYMVGNHDWFYHLPDRRYNEIRQRVIEAMGLANPAGKPFPHDPAESKVITKLFEEHQVFARHGDIYDPFNFEEDRDRSSLGDAIVVDLLNRFPAEVGKRLSKSLPEETLAGLKELDNVRPLARIPIWIDGLLTRTCPDPAARREVKRIWNELADVFVESEFVRQRDTWRPLELVDKLQASLRFSTLMPLSLASRLASKAVAMADEGSYSAFAITERAFRHRRARFIVYGHTHHYEIVALDTSYTGAGRFDQVYINSGTWRRVHEQAMSDPSDQEFLDWNVMTYLAFFKDDERRGRLFETWSGALGVAH